MFPAILTTLFFALSGVTGQKVAIRLGAQWGNFVRLSIAAVFLGLISLLLFPDSFHHRTFLWFFVSGLVGFGLGDVALFAAYERLGSRLTILLNLCLAPVFALSIEWLWLGNRPVWKVLVCVAVILLGVGFAIMRGSVNRVRPERKGRFSVGVIAAVIAGFGQGTGAVISRKAESVAKLSQIEIHGISAAFQRVLAGVLVGFLVVLVLRFLSRRSLVIPGLVHHRKVCGWLFGAALFGPVIGVSCFQWALKTQESGVVLAVVALTPIVMMPLSAVTEKDIPGPWSILGAVVAVVGVMALYLWA
ncbi:MAG: DMT family transporter [Verrucomicrobiales bacterium]|nr:DMT family transporter [Verrucomicrobiales bacterium]